MSSKTYIFLRRELINNSRKLSRAIRLKHEHLIEGLTAKVNMLIAQLSKVMTLAELKKVLASAGLVFALGTSATDISAQSFGPPVADPFGLSDIFQGAWIDFADMDGDGDLDGIAGGANANEYGVILYFENIGNSEQAAFIPPVENPFGINVPDDDFLMPTAVDIDDDGDLDLVYSSYYGISFLENSGSNTQPVFEEPVSAPFGITPVEYMFSPTFADLDNDGDLDLMIGSYYYEEYSYNYEASIYYYENTGDASNPQFAAPVENPFGISTPGYYFAFPALADLDNDGDLDLLVGDLYNYYSGSYYTTLRYFENVGSATEPEFAASQENPFGLSGGYYLSYPVFADMDDDGDMDLFVGEVNMDDYQYGRFLYFENLGTSSVTPVVDSEELDVYPNPVRDVINIRCQIDIKSIEILDALGRINTLPVTARELNVSNYQPGIATLRVTDVDGRTYVRRFVISN